MSKTKTGGKTKQKPRRPGKRLGVKIYGGQSIKPGQIIVRQRGSKFRAGEGVGEGSDYTLFAKNEGKLVFRKRRGKQEIVII